MLCAVDIGNTNVVFGFFREDALLKEMRISTCGARTEDEYVVFLSAHGIEFSAIKGVVISCVAPFALPAIRRLFSRSCSGVEAVVVENNHKVHVNGVITPVLGSDLAVNAIAAYHIFKNDCLIVDFGTATTFSLLEYNVDMINYSGVAIAPGLGVMLQCLKQSTSQLPLLNFQKAETVLGRTTIGAMHAGSYFGFVGLVENIILQVRKEYNKPLKVVATGGLSQHMVQATDKIDIIEPNLTLLGLKLFYLESNTLRGKCVPQDEQGEPKYY